VPCKLSPRRGNQCCALQQLAMEAVVASSRDVDTTPARLRCRALPSAYQSPSGTTAQPSRTRVNPANLEKDKISMATSRRRAPRRWTAACFPTPTHIPHVSPPAHAAALVKKFKRRDHGQRERLCGREMLFLYLRVWDHHVSCSEEALQTCCAS
jgi:hypothetical protein